MKSFAEIDIEKNGNYLRLLSAASKMSGLFSDSSIPYINYRVAENIFCRSFDANNLSRSDTAFDANYNSLGVGLKTFICNNASSIEKVAEFNSLSRILSEHKGKDLAIKLGEYRNERIKLANRLYNIENSLYHIVARKEKKLLLFETDYNTNNIENIHSVKDNKATLQFEDGNNFYSFNHSKSTLYRRFVIPNNAFSLSIEIIEDPYSLLLELFENKKLVQASDKLIKGKNYVILPLYGIKNKEKFVFEKSGLNQWNAGGRRRDLGEVYIPIPKDIHNNYPNFFPTRDVEFQLEIPTGEIFRAKVCQDNSKAFMTNPNKALSDWLLRKLFQIEEGQLATIEKMTLFGFDSVIIYKDSEDKYRIDKASLNSYEEFLLNT